MTPSSAAALAPIFPLLLIAILSDRRSLHLEMRRLRLYRWAVLVAVTAAIAGVVICIVTAGTMSISTSTAGVIWMLFVLVIVPFLLSAIMQMASHELLEDQATEEVAEDELPDAAAGPATSKPRRFRLEISFGRPE